MLHLLVTVPVSAILAALPHFSAWLGVYVS